MNPYTFDEMKRALAAGWGDLGTRVATCWAYYNQLYFDGRLKPLPIFLTQTSPYGNWVGLTCIHDTVTHIALTAPKQGEFLVADRGVLLHEMIHQHLFESGEYPSHDGEPWRRAIMRLHRDITRKELWAGKSTVTKKRTENGRKSVRFNLPHPETGEPSITQEQIARWPNSVGIDLGPL
jgi:hypothetical protein